MGWSAYEHRSRFVSWATSEDEEGIRYAIVERTPCPGLGWVRLHRLDGCIVEQEASGGAFYDGAEGHPEGAVAWARASAKAHARRVRAYLASFDQRCVERT